MILDADTGKVVDVNPFLMQLLGYSYDEFCGKYHWEIGAFKDIAASKDAFNVLQNNEYIRYEDLPLETHDGRSIAVEFVSNVYCMKITSTGVKRVVSKFKEELHVRFKFENWYQVRDWIWDCAPVFAHNGWLRTCTLKSKGG